jgi:hypothetical protein
MDESTNKEFDFDEFYKNMAQADLPKMAAELKDKRSELEQKLNTLTPYPNSDCIKMIIDYAVLLNGLHSKAPDKHPSKKEAVEHLVAATFAVAFATAQDSDVAKLLPILAVSGANIDLAEQLIKDYYSVLEKNPKET